MKLKNQIDKKQKKKDIVILSVFLVINTLALSSFLLTELFMWTFNIYLTPNFLISCIQLLLCIFIILGLIIASKPAIKVDEKGLLIYDPFNLIKRIPSDYITQITVQSNTMIIDDKYENATELVDVFYMNKKLRFALDKKDYSRFIEITYIAKKLK